MPCDLNSYFISNYGKFIFVFVSIFWGFKALTQNNPCDTINISGKWAVCHSEDLDKPCKLGLGFYDFKEDGTFKLTGVKVDYADNVVFDGKWMFLNNVLTLECDYNKTIANPIPQIINVVFINSKKFYKVEEPLPGCKLYTVFQNIK